jgi:shikimate O-hydroxycinnamoyltransferase
MINKNSTTEFIQAEESKSSPDVWQFSPLDQACLRMVLRGTWLFAGQLDVDDLKEGLKELLAYYPHLAGRMKEASGITLTNDGVPFTVVDKPGWRLEDLEQRDDFTNINEMTTGIKPARLKKGFDSPLTVKLTRLKDGSVLGVQCSHACMDGESFYTMAYNWGQICRKQEIAEPVLDQSRFPVPGELPKEEAEKAALESGWVKMSLLFLVKLLPLYISGTLKKRSRGFHIPADLIERLKQEIAGETGIRCSANVALSALITKKCFDLYNHNEDTSCSQVTVVNCRDRLPGVPSTFVGNASTTITTPAFKAGANMADIAAIIDQTLDPVRQKPSPRLQELFAINFNVMKNRLPYAPFDVPGMHAKKPTVAYINNFSKLPIYDLDFGSGKPRFVIPHDLGDQVVIWPAHPGKGGVEVYFSGIPACMKRGKHQ